MVHYDMDEFQEIEEYLLSLSPKEQEAFIKEQQEKLNSVRFIPNPGPQTEAYFSKADVMLYGGSAGGGKTALINGLALSAHKKSHIFRRKYADLSAISDDLRKMYGSQKGFSKMPRPKLITEDGRVIEFGACQHLGDEQAWQGQAADLKAFDEVTQFLEEQVRYIITWNRTVEVGQRCRVIFASNPPTSSDGDWIIPFFAPWLDPNHPNPAKSGELRWFVTDPDGKDLEVPDKTPYQFPGTKNPVVPKSRTFVQAKLEDNPYLIRTDYAATLDALPEPLRSAMRDGNFMLSRKDSEWQVIPSEWVRQAQARWKPELPPNVPQSCIACDVAQGGADENVIAMRYDFYYPNLIKIPGKDTPLGTDMAGPIAQHRRDASRVVLDVGGGYGGSCYKTLKDNDVDVFGYNGSKKAHGRSRDGRLKFVNYRAQTYWQFREALDPSQPGGSRIALPPDNQLFNDLTAPTYSIQTNGIKVESKQDIKKRLGRSPDSGDAVVMAWCQGTKGAAVDQMYSEAEHGVIPGMGGSKTPKVNLGYSNRRRK